jgi:hypothetical protein
LNPRPASLHSSGAAMCTESQDSEHTVSEAAVREIVAPDKHATAESPTLEMVVTVTVGLSK